jgi:dethiobiotin synthase
MHRFRVSAPVRYWKPVQTGIEEDDDTAVVRTLGQCRETEVLGEGERLRRPLSPHLSARFNGSRIAVDSLVTLAAAQPASDRWIVEGAGGLLVPLNDQELVADLIARLVLPVIIVARSALGTINHTLLTLDALRARALDPIGVLMVGEINRENRLAIEAYGRVPVLGEIPPLNPLTPLSVKKAAGQLDSEGVLAECFA